MTKFRKFLLICLLAALTFSIGLFAVACNDTPDDSGSGNTPGDVTDPGGNNPGGENPPAEVVYHTVSFDAAGGSYAAGAPDPIQVAEGALLLEAVREVAPPVKSSLTFGNWFLNGTELNANTKMPAQDITLVANYKVDYVIESYLQNTSRNSYIKQGETAGSDYVGTVLSPAAPTHTGFVYNGSPEGGAPVATLELSEDAENNVFRFYFDRRLYTVYFDANAPAEQTTGTMEALEAYYELNVELTENAFTYEGHRFVGWSTSLDGDFEYADGGMLTVLGNVQLFAVWDRGYVDRYGGEDVVFFPTLEPDNAILSRGGQEFKGTREGDNFSFETPNGTVLNGKVYPNYFFSYERGDLANTYVFYANTPDPAYEDHQYDSERTLTIEPYMTAVYKNHGHTCNGNISYAEQTGDYIFTSEDESFRFLPADKDDRHPYEYDHVFSLGGDEADTYIDFIWLDRGTGSGFLGQTMGLLLDGYSTAMLIDLTNQNYFDGRYYVTGTETVGAATLTLVTLILTDDMYGSLSGTPGAKLAQYLCTLPLEGEYNGFVFAERHRNTYKGDPEAEVKIGKESYSLKDATVELDGFGIFENSAKCTIGGVTYEGTYNLTTDLLSGSVLTVYKDQAPYIQMQVDLDALTVSAPRSEVAHTEFRWMDGNALHPPFLFLYDEDVLNGQTVLGKKMEVWVPNEDEDELIRAASGYCTVETIGSNSRVDFNLYTFHRTWVEDGYDKEIATEMLFYNTSVTSTTDYLSYNVYCLLGETKGGEKLDYRKIIKVSDGGVIWQCTTVSTTGLGSLYIVGNEVYEGQFTIEKSTNFDRTVGTFLYATESGDAVTLRFEMSDQNTTATPLKGTETLLYLIPATGPNSAGVGHDVLFIDGVGLARRGESADGSTFSYTDGTYSEVGTTTFGETIYAFYVGGTERFRFVITTLPGEDFEGVLFGIRYDETIKKDTFVSGNATLTIDHYHTATLDRGDGAAVYGDYFITDLSGGSIVFTDRNGVEFKFFIHDDLGTFEETDWAVGYTWQLLDSNYEPIGDNYHDQVIEFDGNGNITVYSPTNKNGTLKTGHYRPLGTFNEAFGYEEYLIYDISLNDKDYPQGAYKVTFAFNANSMAACFVCNMKILENYENRTAVFIDGDWNVLTLDGFNRGSIVTGAYSGTGTVEVIDYEKNFISLTIDDDGYSSISGQVFYYLLGGNGTFFSTDYEGLAAMGKAGLYFADDMQSVVLGTNGTAYIGSNNGPYYVQNDTAHVYLTETPTEVKIGDKKVTCQGVDYHLCDSETLTFNGVVYLLKKDEQISDSSKKIDAILTFTPNMTTNANRAATFTLKGKGESGGDLVDDKFALSLYTSSGESFSESSKFSPNVVYDRHVYPISFTYKDGTFTFVVTAGYNSVEYLDHTARYYENEPVHGKDENGDDIVTKYINRGMRIFKTSFGFGPISNGETTLSGDFLYLYDEDSDVYSKPIHFEGVKESDVYKVGYVPSYKDRMELVFHGSDGKDYALNYYEWYEGGVYFWCFGLYTYKDYTSADGNYTVRAKTLVYTKMSTVSGFADAAGHEPTYGQVTDTALGKITNVTLFDKKNGDAVLIEYDTGSVLDGYGKGVWLVEIDSVLEKGTTGTCAWGDGYLITFTGTDDNITAVKVEKYEFVQVVNYAEYLINLFVDENGKVRIVGLGVFNGNFGRYDWLSSSHGYQELADGHFTVEGTWEGKDVRFDITVTKDADITVTDGDEQVQKSGYTVTVTMTTL